MKFIVLTSLLFAISSQAATILQTKGPSAIIEVSDTEVQTLGLQAGQVVQFTVDAAPVNASVVKVIKNKILVKANKDLTGKANVAVELIAPHAGGGAAATTTAEAPAAPEAAPAPVTHSKPARSAKGSKSMGMKKPWIAGVNLKYITGSGKVSFAASGIVPAFDSNQTTSGFGFSGIGIYYFGQLGAGAEVEYASLKGSDSGYSTTATQMQLSALGEYKITPVISAGVVLTLASNLKSTDNVGNDSSLNGMGFGVFGTYNVTPEIRVILDYRSIPYKLDSNSITLTDIRIGGGYYF